MSLTKAVKPNEEEIESEAINKIITLKQRPRPEVIVSEALQKSIEIIAKYDYKLANDNQLIEYKKCFFCNKEFPTIPGKIISCKNCGENFCVQHRNILNHSCRKLDPNTRKILAAQKLVKERMRKMKMKGY